MDWNTALRGAHGGASRIRGGQNRHQATHGSQRMVMQMHCLGEVGWPPAGSTGHEGPVQGSSRLLKAVAVHGDHVIADALVLGPGMGFGTGGSQSREQRQQVLIAGLGLHRIGMLLA